VAVFFLKQFYIDNSRVSGIVGVSQELLPGGLMTYPTSFAGVKSFAFRKLAMDLAARCLNPAGPGGGFVFPPNSSTPPSNPKIGKGFGMWTGTTEEDGLACRPVIR
jgi:hypothetical protein